MKYIGSSGTSPHNQIADSAHQNKINSFANLIGNIVFLVNLIEINGLKLGRGVDWVSLHLPGEQFKYKGWGDIKFCRTHKVESVAFDVEKMNAISTVLGREGREVGKE